MLAWGLSACSSVTPPQAPTQDVAAPPAEPERSAWPEPAAPESVVHAEFQTSARAVKPRGKFLLAVRFEIAKGYRISWSNPGDVGKSTKVSFQVPEGFSVGPLQFPAPSRFEWPGDLVSYGYEGDTAVFAEITAPDRLTRDEAYRFEVRADWLACMDECATEELNAWFELTFAPGAPEPALSPELAAHHAAIPRAFSDLPKSKSDWKGSPRRPALALSASDVKWLDFFPGDTEQPKLIQVKPAGDVLNLKFEGTSASTPLRGLAVGEVEGKLAHFDVSVPWPEQ
jgi:DsbC/DsbD-like thiol-disulfide interchange protein